MLRTSSPTLKRWNAVGRILICCQAIVFAMGVLTSLGCGNSGANRCELHGLVTHRGTPIPVGRIDFVSAAGDSEGGSTGYAIIENGAFDTGGEGQHPPVGKLRVKIAGFDGKSNPAEELKYGRALFEPYQSTIDVTSGRQKIDFSVP